VEIETLLLGQIARYLVPAKLSDLTYGKLEKFSTHRRFGDGVAAATLNKQIRTVRAVQARAVNTSLDTVWRNDRLIERIHDGSGQKAI
jgi:hypothetical protein